MQTLKEILLQYPIDVEGAGGARQQITSVTLRRMRAKDFQFLPSDEAEARKNATIMLPLVASLTGLTKEQTDEIDAEDLMNIVKELANFLSGFLGTGGISSGESQPLTTSRRRNS
jgi:hypothetical protein